MSKNTPVAPLSAAPDVPVVRRFPVGAEVRSEGGVHFRVWAPRSSTVSVQLWNHLNSPTDLVADLQPEEDGYFSGFVPDARAGMFYKFVVDRGAFPDPASRFQPQGPHGPSQIIDPAFRWTDSKWNGVSREGQVIYEMHIGAFTGAGDWAAAAEELPELARLGITVLEIMPVADFAGNFGWGYDGVNLFAPTRLYGTPDDFRNFVNGAHNLGMGVILDVVYNHFGPSGNYLREFSEHYFSKCYTNEWGDPVNFDDEHSGPVREFFLANVAYWISEFHLDGLRLDATQQMFDVSPRHIVADIVRIAREAAGNRHVYILAENEPQEARLIQPVEQQGFDADAVWNDDFHHSAMVALTGRNEAYYTDYKGTPQEFISAIKHGFLYQGQWYVWQKKNRGTPALDLSADRFVAFLQNHDQVANSLRGQRLHQLTSPGRSRAFTALLLLGPNTPMLFQGQEFAASAPFLYFADHEPDLAIKVVEGRRQFLSQFRSMASVEMDPFIADPADKHTFKRCKLDFSERQKNAGIYRLHRDLLRLRKEDPVFSNPAEVDGAVLAHEAFLIRMFGENDNDRLLIVNMGVDLHLAPAPEPLLAPPVNSHWILLWSSEEPIYGG
ncbi:MAG TPA: malto-oligosyltrehalose trehalohydrolase, partial [Desulfuromonadaceae bacterium]|nr:malto-oligosyltrehalose trehalohydrolase [Desulfuromonadaceae bacterium]